MSAEEVQLLARLAQRVGRCHLSQRLGIEEEREAWVFGQGRNWFHIENWSSAHGWIRLACQVALLYGRGRRNARAIRVQRNTVVLPELPAAFEGFTLLHLSDLHLDMAADFPGALIAAVGDLDYDVCVITGDFRARTYGPYQPALDAMAKVRPHLKGDVYAILGNHDTLRLVPGLEALGVRLLLNESVALQRGDAALYLAGLDDPHYYRADNLEKATDAIPEGVLSILLSHSPEMYRHGASAGFDLMLCGHTHGGQICLPGGLPIILNARAPRRYGRGAWRYRHMQGYTSTGFGSSIVDVRLNCPPEVTLHRLTCGLDCAQA